MKICYNPSSNYVGIGILQSTLDTSTGDLLELGYFELRDVATLDCESLAGKRSRS